MHMPPIQKEDPSPTRMGDQKESPTVINLSGVTLDNNKISLLSRGFSFFPTPWQANNEAILDDLEGYFRHLRLKEFFLYVDEDDKEISDNAETQTQILPPPSKLMPSNGRDTALEASKRSRRTWNLNWK